MNVLLFGATGMIGQGALRECLLDPAVTQVVAVGRGATGQRHQKLREIVHKDLFDLTPIASELTGFDACFFCLGTSSAGMSEDDYRRITYDLTLSVAQTLAPLNPQMTFIYISGVGADSSEQGRVMWARVRGKTENDLLKLPFKAVYIVRPGFVQPLHGIKSRTRLYRALYGVAGLLLPVIKRVAPNQVATTEQLGRGLITIGRRGYSKPIIYLADINTM